MTRETLMGFRIYSAFGLTFPFTLVLSSASDFLYEKTKHENITKRVLWLLCTWDRSHRLTGMDCTVGSQPVWMDVVALSGSAGGGVPRLSVRSSPEATQFVTRMGV